MLCTGVCVYVHIYTCTDMYISIMAMFTSVFFLSTCSNNYNASRNVCCSHTDFDIASCCFENLI